MINLRDGKITDLISNPMAYNPETASIGYAILREKQRLIALAELSTETTFFALPANAYTEKPPV